MNNKELDLETEWEQLVNNRTRLPNEDMTAEEWAESLRISRRNNRRTKLVTNAAYCVVSAAVFGVLLCTGLLPWWLSLPTFLVMSCVASANIGRVLEMNRR